MNALAEDGVEGVRVEVLAKRLAVTKGGFYWHFRDRQDLLQATLDIWKAGRIETIIEHASGEAGAALASMLQRYVARSNPRGTAIELAIRNWARRDPCAAQAVAEVDQVRLERVRSLYRGLGYDEEQAYARGYLFYAYVFGQSLLISGACDKTLASARRLCHQLLVAPAPKR